MYSNNYVYLKEVICLMEMKIRLKMKNRSHRNDLNRPRPRYEHKYTKYKMRLVHFLVNQQTQKHSPRFVLKNMCSENISEIFFFFCKVAGQNHERYWKCIFHLLDFAKIERNVRTLRPTSVQNNSEGAVSWRYISRLPLKAPRDHM